MQGDDIDVALAEDEIGPFGLLCQIDAVQVPALAVNDGLRGVHILGLRLVQDPAAEGHHVPLYIDDGKHKPVPEFVIDPPLLIGYHQPRRQKVRLSVPLLQHGVEQRVPLVQGSAQPEVHSGLPADLPPLQIGGHRRPLGAGQITVEPPGGVPVHGQHPLAAAGLLKAGVVLGHLHIGPLCQKAHRVGEVQIFDLHDELDHASAVVTAEAVIDLLVRRHGEGTRLLVVEGAQAEVVASLFAQRNIGGNDIHDVAAVHQLVQKTLRKRH